MKFFFLNINKLNFLNNFYFQNNYFYKILSVNFRFFCFNIFFKKFRKNLYKYRPFYLNKNLNLVNVFLNMSFRSGYKNTLFKHFKFFLLKYRYVMIYDIEPDEFFNSEDFFNSYMFYDLLKDLYTKKLELIQFSNILFLILPYYNSLFKINVKKLSKSKRLKLKKNYIYTVKYIAPKKRLSNTLKLVNIQSYYQPSNHLFERYFHLFLDVLLNPLKNVLKKRRDYVYSKILKKRKRLD